MIREIGENIWTIDGSPLTFAGAEMGTRMTVIKLASGDLWVHSPIELTREVTATIAGLGSKVTVLVAPNKFHYLFLPTWRAAWPEATVYAEPRLLKKVPAINPAIELTNDAPAVYKDDIDQLLFTGNRVFQEAVFFHLPSKTLILTDLFINLCVDHVPLLPRLFLQFEQVVYPSGGIPRLFRWFTHDKEAARTAAKKIVAWQPKQITFSHGDALQGTAEEILNTQFGWLLAD